MGSYEHSEGVSGDDRAEMFVDSSVRYYQYSCYICTKRRMVLLCCVSGGHVASGTWFRTTEDPAGDWRLDASGSGSAAET